MSIKNDAFIYSIGSILAKAIPFFIIPYLTNKLGVVGYGQLTFLISVSAFILSLTLFSLDSACVRYYYRYSKESSDEIIIISVMISLIISIPIFIIVIVFNYNTIYIHVIILALLQSVFTILTSKFNFQKKAVKFVFFQIVNSILSLIMTIVYFEILNPTVLNRLNAICITYFIVSFFILYSICDNYKKIIKRSRKMGCKFVMYALSFGFPLLFHNVSFVLKGNFDRILINSVYSEHQLGVYALGAQMASVIGVIILSVNKALVPHLYEKIKSGSYTKKDIVRNSLLSYGFIILLFILCISVPDKFFLYVFGSGFIGVSYYFYMFSLSVLLSIPYLLSVNFLFFHGETKLIAIFNIATAIVHLLCVKLFSYIDIKLIPVSGIISTMILSILIIYKVNNYGNK